MFRLTDLVTKFVGLRPYLRGFETKLSAMFPIATPLRRALLSFLIIPASVLFLKPSADFPVKNGRLLIIGDSYAVLAPLDGDKYSVGGASIAQLNCLLITMPAPEQRYKEAVILAGIANMYGHTIR